jgi:SAM-dependent methyltransferase
MKKLYNHDEAVRKLFAESSADYANLFLSHKTGKNFAFRQRLVLVTEVSQELTGRLFDCATGSGEIAASILAKGNFDCATLLDISQDMLDLAVRQIGATLAGKKLANIEFKCDDVFNFAVKEPNNQYDYILCLGLIAHTGRLDELLILLRGLLAKHGIIYLQTTLLDHWGTKIERFFTEERFLRNHGYRIAYFRHKDIVSACAQAGLKIVSRKRYSIGIPFGDRIFSWGNYHLERIFRSRMNNWGSEAIYTIKADKDA